MHRFRILLTVAAFGIGLTLPGTGDRPAVGGARAEAGQPRIAIFDVDVSPPVGSPLAYDPCVEVTDPLSCRGVILLGAGEPIVMAAIDWLGVANEAHVHARRRIADAVGTSVERVALHALHQHDAPRCDFTSAALMSHYGVGDLPFDVPWAREVLGRVAAAAKASLDGAQPFDRIGLGQAEVSEVASNRRIQDDTGRVIATRYTACRDPALRAAPVGTIDPLLRSISFYQGDRPLAVLTYYATHPQSFYRTGQANPDFPGYARDARQRDSGIPHIHFNGAGGNIGAGKWNDGSRENRQALADRVARAMDQAWASSETHPIDAGQIGWTSVAVALPPGEHLIEEALVAVLKDGEASVAERLTAAKHLAWLRRTRDGQTVDIQCLRLGGARVLHMPGELFVEYQLAAAEMRPDLFVAMAAYGEYGPGYIGTEIAYSQGGYETSERASRVAPAVEQVLRQAMARLLEADRETPPPGQ